MKPADEFRELSSPKKQAEINSARRVRFVEKLRAEILDGGRANANVGGQRFRKSMSIHDFALYGQVETADLLMANLVEDGFDTRIWEWHDDHKGTKNITIEIAW